jgi:putative hydrolase of the HAD superfamily
MPSNRPIDAVLFDLYDTLARPDGAMLDAGRLRLAERAGVEVVRLRKEWQRTYLARSLGTLGGMEDELRDMLTACDLTPTVAVLAELAALEYATWRDSVRLFEDSLPALEWLRRDGYRLGIVSNCSCQAGAVVDPLGLREAVDTMVLSCEVGLMKPDPAIYTLAMERLGTTPERTLLVDDLPENLDAARSIGMKTALIVRYDPALEATSDHPVLPSLYRLGTLFDSPLARL